MLDHYRFNCGIVSLGSNPTFTNCKIAVPQNMGVGIYHVGTGGLTAEDCTSYRTVPAGVGDIPIHMFASDNALTLRRCEAHGGGDLVHFTAAGSLISQCYLHNMAFVDESQHADGIQVYNGAGGSVVIEHNHIDATGAEGTNLEANSCMTCGTANATLNEPDITVTVRDNYFNGGLNSMRINFDTIGITVEDNDWGPISAFGEISVEVPSEVIAWSNNRDSDGNLIAQP